MQPFNASFETSFRPFSYNLCILTECYKMCMLKFLSQYLLRLQTNINFQEVNDDVSKDHLILSKNVVYHKVDKEAGRNKIFVPTQTVASL